MWVGRSRAMSVSIVNVANRQIDRVIDLSKRKLSPKCLAFDGRYMWIGGTGGVVRVERAEDVPVAEQINSPGDVLDLAFDGSRMWLAASNAVRFFDVVTPSMWGAPSDGLRNCVLRGLVFDGVHMWVLASTGGLPAAQADDDRAGARALNVGPQAMSQTEQGVLCKLDADTGAFRGCVALDAPPVRAAFDGTHLWVATTRTGFVHRVLVG